MVLHGSMLALVAGLADLTRRREAARRLARQLGAEDLLVFIPDLETGVLLPAPGFPQTLPHGREWRAFLAACASEREQAATLPFPPSTEPGAVWGVAEGGSVLVLVGGLAPFADLAVVRDLLPLLTAAFRGEQQAVLAKGRSASVAAAAANATALAATLDVARREVQDALRQAENALRLRDEFLSAVTHDLRSPLTTLQGMSELLRRRAIKEDTPATARIAAGLEMIGRTSRRMAAMVQELLDLSQLQAGRRLALNCTPIDLTALIQEVVRDMQQTTSPHTLRVDAPSQAIVGAWDRERLERVWSNLLSNAVKYSPDGGAITVSVSQEDTDSRRWAVVTVADEGLGIEAADLPHIFERFYRAASVSGRIRGTGIGLAGAKQIVAQHAGSMSVTSAVGRGSRFTVRLPLD